MAARTSGKAGKPATGAAARGAKQPAAVGASLSNGSAGRPGPAQLMLDLDFVRGLIAAVDDSGIDSLEINRGGTRIRISKTPPVPAAAPTPAAVSAPPAVTAPTAGPGDAVSGTAAPTGVPAPEAGTKVELVDVRSPMVGTFYRAPAPEAPPYVEVGSHVSKGQILCILEAMKLMNELDSEVDGIVREILAENADPVEYGQVLFRIEPTGP